MQKDFKLLKELISLNGNKKKKTRKNVLFSRPVESPVVYLFNYFLEIHKSLKILKLCKIHHMIFINCIEYLTELEKKKRNGYLRFISTPLKK